MIAFADNLVPSTTLLCSVLSSRPGVSEGICKQEVAATAAVVAGGGAIAASSSPHRSRPFPVQQHQSWAGGATLLKALACMDP